MPHLPRNPADLLRLGSDPALCRLLRACGVEESYITGGASDCDKFLALAAALPLCEGHPLRDEVNAALSQATGLAAPLCPHTAHTHWNAWAEIYRYGGRIAASPLPAVCPFCPPSSPTVLTADALCPLPDPAAVKAPDLDAWSDALSAALPADGRLPLFSLSNEYGFVRPDPYHAGLAVRKAWEGEALTDREMDLLRTQALRVWGQTLVQRGGGLLLEGGTPETVSALLYYLDRSRALAETAWIPVEPAQAAGISGLYPGVRTGYRQDRESDSQAARAYAAAAPLGRGIAVTGRSPNSEGLTRNHRTDQNGW